MATEPSRSKSQPGTAYILCDRKLIPEAANAVERVFRTEVLDVIPKSMAEACMRHGFCSAELIIWYVMKQLILPPDASEVTIQKKILTPPKVPPATLDQASKWLEEMQHRLNLCIKTKQNVHPQTLIAFAIETVSGITQYYRTIGNIWDTLYSKHQLRDSDITLDRVYAMLSEFLIELKLNEEQEKITQIVTGNSGTPMKPSAYDEYINASKGKMQQKGKGRGGEGKGGKQNWRQPCNDYWKPEGCQHGHHCPKYHPRRQPGRCAICGSTRHDTSQCTRPVKPKAKSAEYDENMGMKTSNGKRLHGRLKSTKLLRVRKAKERSRSQKGSPRARALRDLSHRDLLKARLLEMTDPIPKPNQANDFLFAMMSTKSKPTWRHSTWNGEDLHRHRTAEEAPSVQTRKVVSGIPKSNRVLWT